MSAYKFMPRRYFFVCSSITKRKRASESNLLLATGARVALQKKKIKARKKRKEKEVTYRTSVIVVSFGS